MATIFDLETLEMLFSEVEGMDFEAWCTQYGYDPEEPSSDFTDRYIYSILPTAIIESLNEFGINASWMHNGM